MAYPFMKTFQMERQFLFVLITVLYPIFLIADHYRIKKNETHQIPRTIKSKTTKKPY